jgi:hypothetical protein
VRTVSFCLQPLLAVASEVQAATDTPTKSATESTEDFMFLLLGSETMANRYVRRMNTKNSSEMPPRGRVWERMVDPPSPHPSHIKPLTDVGGERLCSSFTDIACRLDSARAACGAHTKGRVGTNL